MCVARVGEQDAGPTGIGDDADPRAGRLAQARKTVAALLGEKKERFPATAVLAAALDAIGDHERAVAVLRTAVEQHDPWLANKSRGPIFDRLRTDPRAAALLAHVEAP